MPQDRREHRRWPLGRALATMLLIAIGLTTEAAGGLLPPLAGRETWVWAILGALVVLVVVLELVTNKPARAGQRRPGQRVQQFSPADLEVHDPVEVPGQRLPVQTTYVRRAHDEQLAAGVRAAIGGSSRLVTLVADSSTGKTRACHEAVQGLPKQWRLWHPIDPSRPEAVLGSLGDIRTRTVVWINDAHHYLATADPAVGEQVAAGLRTLLTDSRRAPVLILATLWPQFWRQLTTIPPDGQPDPHAQARALLTGTEVTVPTAFTGDDLAAVETAAVHDPRLAGALEHAEAGRIAQYLAGVPQLLRRYRTASPGARAVLDAAIDARRLGHPVHLPPSLLQTAAPGYLSQSDQTVLHRRHGRAWFDLIVDDLDQPQHGVPGPLTRVTTDGHATLRLADAVEQAGTIVRAAAFPPASFWDAVAATVTEAALLTALAAQAERRGRYRRAVRLYGVAAERGSTDALRQLAIRWEEAGDQDAAERLRQEAADRGDTYGMREEAWRATDPGTAERLLREAADHGLTDALRDLAFRREQAGDRTAAAQLFREAADRGNLDALRDLAVRREDAGDHTAAEQLFREAADRGNTKALRDLARRREQAGDPGAAEQLARRLADDGDTYALRELALRRQEAGDHTAAQQLAREVADRGDTSALRDLALRREEVGDHAAAEQLARQVAERGNTHPLRQLAFRRDQAGDHGAGELLLREAADRGDTHALQDLALRREEAGDHATAEQLLRQAGHRGDVHALQSLSRRRAKAGDDAAAEQLLREAAELGDTESLWSLALRREETGDHAAAERLVRQAADHGDPDPLRFLARRRDDTAAERLLLEAADRGHPAAVPDLAERRKKAGDYTAAARLLRFGLTDDGEPAESLR